MKMKKKEMIEEALKKQFPGEKICVTSAELNTTGVHETKGSTFNEMFGATKGVSGLPDYMDVRVEWQTGEYAEKIIIWSPVEWNGRFAGTAGGGMTIGGEGSLTTPDEYSRGWTVPYAVMKGYTAATADGCNIDGITDHVLDAKTGNFSRELYENWRARTTHHMTLIGKAVAQILHDRPIEYSYLNGGSGGGRQSLVEVQEYPEDYDGVWASCPGINWGKFLLQGLWACAVMNSSGHRLSPEKAEFFMKAAWESVGGRDAYFKMTGRLKFDAHSLVGERVNGSRIMEADAKIMNALWDGSVDKDGKFLWYGFRPGAKFWNVGVPIGSFYYPDANAMPRPFVASTLFARWITGNPAQDFSTVTLDEYERIFKEANEKFSDCLGDKADLSSFACRGGKLIVDHGMNDPLIPIDGTIDYYNRVVQAMGESETERFFRLYVVPGDGHGSCYNEEPGITQSMGIEALVRWVEHGERPGVLDGVKVNQETKQILKTGKVYPVDDIKKWM